jgi:hypothetical protein
LVQGRASETGRTGGRRCHVDGWEKANHVLGTLASLSA